MNDKHLLETLKRLEEGQISAAEAYEKVRYGWSDRLGFAEVDLNRVARRGLPEVVFGPNKTVDHITEICRSLNRAQQRILVTRIDAEHARAVIGRLPDVPLAYESAARCLRTADTPNPTEGRGTILVVTAGTSDYPVAAEAIVTIQHAGHPVETLFDVGVAGLHRLLGHLETLRRAEIIIVCAGMEGALPSVIAGLVTQPVIAVPTSVGYGVQLEGITTLLAMMSSCAAGVTVVNIDNGFGAAYAACAMNRQRDQG
ncbi:MAG: nickel pincer cofactor biosynthesis protein LarB [Myxococcota bacterium]|nr:nickel pincer cofactor biosynthesis protein LarB [Myxococcota bacterium]